jgi:hypothetical protein
MPIANIYSTLLKNKKLDVKQAQVWEQRVLHCDKYTQFSRRYKQNVRFLLSKSSDNEYTLHRNAYHREYYQLPQWEREGGDNFPLQPMADQTYKECQSFDDNSWSSSDDEGNLIGYFSDGNRIAFCENRRTGKLVDELQMVVPYDSDHCNLRCAAAQRNEHGRLITTNDPIKQIYYLGDEDDDECDDPYKELALTRKIERKRRRHLKETGELRFFG